MRFRNLWLGVGLAFVALVIYLSLTHDPPPAPDVGFKINHVLAYAWLMFWFAQVFCVTRTRIAIAIGLALMGVALEHLQGMTGYRTFSYTDMRDNAIGVMVGWMIATTPLGRTIPALDRILARR